ncbi:hypothetical protein UlMin_003798 [Ulmus minor]
MGWFSWLYYLSLLFSFHSHALNSSSSLSFPPPPALCHPDESSALLQFKNTFFIDMNPQSNICFPKALSFTSPVLYNPKTVFWNKSTDCCSWDGVTCDKVTGHVIGIDLACGGLRGVFPSNSSLFLLGHLQSLILSFNDFKGSPISSQFGKFSSLTHLDLSNSKSFGQVPQEISYLSKLVTLDLSGNKHLRIESSWWERTIRNLTKLENLIVYNVNMSLVLPDSLANLSSSLKYLNLQGNRLQGRLPTNIFLLPNLQGLDLSYNNKLVGSLPEYNWSSPLQNLSLSYTKLSIDLPHLTRSLKYLNILFLSHCNFIGSYPALLGNFTNIISLDLSHNNFGGHIPWSFFDLGKLGDLFLSGNNFIGQLPNFCDNSTQISFSCHSLREQGVGNVPITLVGLFLDDNLLNGTIPSSLFNLPSLYFLCLDNNQFSGNIEEFNRSYLLFLLLANNKLEGHIPRSMFKQEYLISLDLSSNNLSGTVDFEQFLKLENLTILNLSSNKYLSLSSNNFINYSLPQNLQSLTMSSCNVSEFPYSLRTLVNLTSLDLSHNQIKGNVPEWLSNVGKDSLNLLDLSHNQLTGEIPSLIYNMSSLEVLDLSQNRFHGALPPCFGNLQKNSTFAEENSSSLRILNLNGNQLEGSLPQTLLNCKNLEVLDLGNNQINDTFPYWLESLPILQVLILKSNKFHGSIPNPKVSLPFQKLRIVDLSYNEFDGLLPTKYFENFVAMMDAKTDSLQYIGTGYYKASVTLVIKGISIEFVKILSIFTTIDFSRNKFEGEIPHSIGELKSLKGLNFSQNKLAGPIPPSLGKLSNLEWLDLSSNELVGEIPPQLANLTQLGNLNLSQNKLVGMIPQGKQFNTFSNDSYSGNLELCGLPLSRKCNEDEAQQPSPSTNQQEDDRGEHINAWKVILMGYGSGLVIGISIGYMVLSSNKFDDWLMEELEGGHLKFLKKGPKRKARIGMRRNR